MNFENQRDMTTPNEGRKEERTFDVLDLLRSTGIEKNSSSARDLNNNHSNQEELVFTNIYTDKKIAQLDNESYQAGSNYAQLWNQMHHNPAEKAGFEAQLTKEYRNLDPRVQTEFRTGFCERTHNSWMLMPVREGDGQMSIKLIPLK